MQVPYSIRYTVFRMETYPETRYLHNNNMNVRHCFVQGVWPSVLPCANFKSCLMRRVRDVTLIENPAACEKSRCSNNRRITPTYDGQIKRSHGIVLNRKRSTENTYYSFVRFPTYENRILS